MTPTEIRAALRTAAEAAERLRAFALDADLPCPEDCAHLLADYARVLAGATACKAMLARLRIEPEHKIAIGLYRDRPRDLVGSAWQGAKIVGPPPVRREGSRCRAMRAPTVDE